MLIYITIIVALISFVAPATAQAIDFDHPLVQEEVKTWNYQMLLDCSLRYDISVGVYEALADDLSHFAAAIQRWDWAYKLHFGYAQVAALAQGVSAAELLDLYDKRMRAMIKPIDDARSVNNDAVADVIVDYLDYAKRSCRPYIEELDARLRSIELSFQKDD